MLTVHLTGLDLVRTVVSPSPAVLVELGAAGDRMVLDVAPDRLVSLGESLLQAADGRLEP